MIKPDVRFIVVTPLLNDFNPWNKKKKQSKYQNKNEQNKPTINIVTNIKKKPIQG